MYFRVPVILTAVIILVAGCAKEKIETDPRLSSPEKAYLLWVESGIKGDIDTSNLCVTEESRKFIDIQIKNKQLTTEKLVEQSARFKEYKVIDTKYKGERAVMLTKSPQKGDTIVLPFKKDGKGWKVDLIALFNM